MTEFKKIKVSVNQSEFENALATYEGKIEFYQNVINQIKSIVPDFVFTENDLSEIFSDPKSYLVDKIIKEPTSINGLELSKDKVFELLKDCDKLTSIVKYVEKLKSNVKVETRGTVTTPVGQFSENHYLSNNERNLHMYTKDYVIDGETVNLKQSFIDSLEDQYSIFLTTERQKNSFDSLEKIYAELNSLSDTHKKNHIKFIEDYFRMNADGNLLGINYAALGNLK